MNELVNNDTDFAVLRQLVTTMSKQLDDNNATLKTLVDSIHRIELDNKQLNVDNLTKSIYIQF